MVSCTGFGRFIKQLKIYAMEDRRTQKIAHYLEVTSRTNQHEQKDSKLTETIY